MKVSARSMWALAQVFVWWPLFGVASPRAPVPPWPEISLQRLDFDEPYFFRSWGGEQKTATVDRSIWVESWSGYALNRQGPGLKPILLPMATPTQWKIAPQEGAIRLWFRPDWSSTNTRMGSGPGGEARLLELRTSDKKASILWWTLSVSPDGNTLYLGGERPEGVVDYVAAPISWQAQDWHLVSVSYSAEETALHVDGLLAALGQGVPEVPLAVAGQTSLAVGTDAGGRNAAGGQVEELITFSYPLSFWNTDAYYRARLESALKGPVTAAEEAAWDQKVAELKALREAGLLEPQGARGEQFFLESMEGFYLLTPIVTNATLALTVWNAETNKSYDILYSRELPASYWSTAVTGALGQTNFTVTMTNLTCFYQAAEGKDWDGDGVDNWADAQPSNPAVSNLVVTIEFPAAGATVD